MCLSSGFLYVHHFDRHKDSNISKCSPDIFERSGETFLSFNENNLSDAGLAGNPVLRVMYNLFYVGISIKR